jgi:hypothetical protein
MKAQTPSAEITKLLKTARAKAVTAMNHAERAIGDPEDALPALASAFHLVDKAASQMEAHFDHSTSGDLHESQSRIAMQRRSLATALGRYLDGEPGGATRQEIREAIRLVHKVTRDLNTLRLDRVASLWERRLEKIKKAVIYTVWIVLIAGIAAGFSVALTQPGYDQGLNAYYHNRPNFRGHQFECIDHRVDNDWKGRAPFRGIPRNNFSVRWEGCVKIDEGTERQIVAGADDRIQVILNGEMIIDDWAPHRFELRYSERVLRPGVYPIEIKYQEEKGAARVFLGWKGLHEKVQAIPPENLLPRNMLIGGLASNRACPKMPPLKKTVPAPKALPNT